MTLTEFVLARIAEDEQRARIAQHDDEARTLAYCAAVRAIIDEHEIMPWRLSRTGYVQDHDGRRWAQYYNGGCCGRCTAGGEYGGNIAEFEDAEPDYCETLRALGTIYADHPDYHEEWRP
jgi:hypothetical protein